MPLLLLLGFGSGSVAPAGSENAWYVTLAKPAATPPDWAFPVAWTTIYALMGVALAIVLGARASPGRTRALRLAAAALGLNLIWTPLFFGAHEVTLAWLLIIAMLGAGIAATVAFGRVRAGAAWALLPYLLWISYAGVLTWRIDRLNPDARALAPGAGASQIRK